MPDLKTASCLGGSTGLAFMYAAVLPISMRQMAYISSGSGGLSFFTSQAIVVAAILAILTVI